MTVNCALCDDGAFKSFKSSLIISQMMKAELCIRIKGTVSVILNDPPGKDENARFTKLNLIKFKLYINVLISLTCLFSFTVSL